MIIMSAYDDMVQAKDEVFRRMFWHKYHNTIFDIIEEVIDNSLQEEEEREKMNYASNPFEKYWLGDLAAAMGQYGVSDLVCNAFHPDMIENVEFFDRVVKMTFDDGTVTVAKLQEGDEYNKEVGMMVCIMEYIYGGKQYNNTFRKWIKEDKKRKAAKAEAEAKAQEEKEIQERQAAKKARRKAARKEKAKQEAIEIQKEAYKQALAETTNGKEDGTPLGDIIDATVTHWFGGIE